MFKFCFNDSIPQNGKDDELVKHLSNTLNHYVTIKNNFPAFVDGIITDRLPEKVLLNGNNFSLKNCIKFLNRELFTIALRNFGKYPVEEYYGQLEIDSILEGCFKITINNIDYDATNAIIAQIGGGVLFTLPVHEELKKNTIVIYDKEKKTCEVLNQFGFDNNTLFISNYIQEDIVQRAGGFDKLLALVGDCEYDSRFKEDFNNLTSASQKKLLSHVHQAIQRNAITRFYPDDEKIKNVTPPKENKIKVFEFRVFTPAPIRVYFYETPAKIYFGSINRKPQKKIQDNDILNAASVIKELIVLEKQ